MHILTHPAVAAFLARTPQPLLRPDARARSSTATGPSSRGTSAKRCSTARSSASCSGAPLPRSGRTIPRNALIGQPLPEPRPDDGCRADGVGGIRRLRRPAPLLVCRPDRRGQVTKACADIVRLLGGFTPTKCGRLPATTFEDERDRSRSPRAGSAAGRFRAASVSPGGPRASHGAPPRWSSTSGPCPGATGGASNRCLPRSASRPHGSSDSKWRCATACSPPRTVEPIPIREGKIGALRCSTPVRPAAGRERFQKRHPAVSLLDRTSRSGSIRGTATRTISSVRRESRGMPHWVLVEDPEIIQAP